MGNDSNNNNNNQNTNTNENSVENLSKQADKLEKKLLDNYASPLNNKSLYYENIPIKLNGENYYLHTLLYDIEKLKSDSTEKKVMIMLHGYQSNSLNYYKIIPLISSKFICIAPDIIGMGLSSRPKIDFKSNEHCVNFFIESINEFIKSLEQIYNLKNNFILCGHSLGGYFACSYALKYPEKIEKLLLLSPTGISDVEKYGGDICENMPFIKNFGTKMSSILWGPQLTLHDISQIFLVKNIVNYNLRKRFEISKEENDILGEITEITLKYPKDLDKAIYYIFKYPFPTPVNPLEDLIKEKIPNMNIIFCYGATDWMDSIGAKRLNKFDPEKYKFFIISNAGHKFPLDNPKEAADIILKELS